MDGSRNGLKSCYHDSAQIGGTYFPRDVFEITPSPTPFAHTYIHYSFGAKSQYICVYKADSSRCVSRHRLRSIYLIYDPFTHVQQCWRLFSVSQKASAGIAATRMMDTLEAFRGFAHQSVMDVVNVIARQLHSTHTLNIHYSIIPIYILYRRPRHTMYTYYIYSYNHTYNI